MRRARLSARPNDDGTYWMMEVNDDYSKLVFTRYKPGEIPETSDPDTVIARYGAYMRREFREKHYH